MYIRIVTFGITVPAEAYAAHAEAVAPAFTTWPGLLGKWWLADAGSGVHGGVYLFADRAAADRSRLTDTFRAMAESPAFTDLTVREFEVLGPPTAVTAPDLAAAA
ncbi:YdhR family protein [Pseudonocardia sp. RS010]|uniref:YdhR family protein n=1 Tax=Pseudonocardia sp. RS010 TaxID=3385979 RepID=UPI0039A02541